MGWSIGYDEKWHRDIGYGVPAYCDQPGCDETIDRGLAHVCCGQEPYGGDEGCGLYFCEKHHDVDGKCERCASPKDANDQLPPPFAPKPEHPQWAKHVLTDPSWAQWRRANPKKRKELEAILAAHSGSAS